jgi:hypothetical protein
MSAATCPRLFEAEAMRDGRLSGTERSSYEGHVTRCAACSREVEALQVLAEAVRSGAGGAIDELHVRREKTRLLAAFDGMLVAPERRPGPRGWLVAAVAAALLLGLFVLRERRLPREARASGAVVEAGPAAVWSDRRDGDRERIVLERGDLRIHVDHAAGQGGLLVVLPDGELEDIGTTFDVHAGDGRTRRVSVAEGHVVLRLRDRPPVNLGPGETWVEEPPAPAPSSISPPVLAAPGPSPPPSDRETRRGPPPAASGAADPSAEFRAAMSALDLGDSHDAAARFEAFVARHPRDPRAEDAAYLRVIALQKCGDAAGTRRAAVDYLRLFPDGFRRAEVVEVAR